MKRHVFSAVLDQIGIAAILTSFILGPVIFVIVVLES